MSSLTLSCRSHCLASVLALLAVLVTNGCTSGGSYRINLMPAPAAFDEESFNPLSELDAIAAAPYRGMLYVTDRDPAAPDDAETWYRNARGATVQVGLGEVTYAGAPMGPETLRRISLSDTRTDKVPLEVVAVDKQGFLQEVLPFGFLTDPINFKGAEPADREFSALINAKLAVSKRKDIYLYVHGYKVIFENPLLVSTELWHFLGYEGVFIAYAWPSTPRRLAYFKDLETAALSGANLRLLLEFLARNTDVDRIHLIGYSAGSRVVITALHQLALMNAGRPKEEIQEDLRIGQVAVVGSDYDLIKFFAAVSDGLLDVPTALSVYMSSYDDALDVSRLLFRERRLGQMAEVENVSPTLRDFLETTEDLHFIDVTEAEASNAGNGHDYFRRSPWASSDLLTALAYGMTPPERGLVRDSDQLTWRFPPDYIRRLRVALSELSAAPSESAQ